MTRNRILGPRVVRIGVALLAVMSVASGCSSGTSSSDKTATASANKAPTSAATKAAAGAATSVASPAAATTGATRSVGGGIVQTGTTPIGTVLTNSAGLTLYTYKNDAPNSGKSAVSSGLAKSWPPLTIATSSPPTVSGVTGTFSVITRDDGSLQIAYNGLPLYLYVNDKSPGDTNGEQPRGLWLAAKP